MKNCLLLGNRAVYDYSDLYMYYFQTNLYNVTIANGSSRDGRSVYFERNATVKNSIIAGTMNKPSSINNVSTGLPGMKNSLSKSSSTIK